MLDEHLSFSHAGFHLISVIALLAWIFYLALKTESSVRRRRRAFAGKPVRGPIPDRSCTSISPRWNSHETEDHGRYVP